MFLDWGKTTITVKLVNDIPWYPPVIKHGLLENGPFLRGFSTAMFDDTNGYAYFSIKKQGLNYLPGQLKIIHYPESCGHKRGWVQFPIKETITYGARSPREVVMKFTQTHPGLIVNAELRQKKHSPALNQYELPCIKHILPICSKDGIVPTYMWVT